LSTKTKIRKLIRWAILCVLVYVALEGLSFAVFWAYYDRVFTFAETNRNKQKIAQYGQKNSKKAGTASEWPLHPFVGHTLLPGTTFCALWGENLDKCGVVNEYGILGPNAFRNKDTYNVLITGGSVAVHAYLVGALKKQLGTLGALSDKKVALFALASPGHRQPQQLMALTYFLILGGKLDLLINLDGVNESTPMPPDGVYPIYPMGWKRHFIQSHDKRTVRIIGKISLAQDERQDLARAANWINFSVTVNLFWSWMDNAKTRRIRALNAELYRTKVIARREPGFHITGPRVDVPDVFDLVFRTWYLSSLQMAALARQNNFKYFHFLQPSALVKGSKPLTSAERRMVLNSYPTGSHDNQYTALRKLGARLKSRGVNFFDLTDVFKDHQEPLYYDFCHFRIRGHTVLAKQIIQAIGSRLQDAPAAPGSK
jgi:hypothetical protein